MLDKQSPEFGAALTAASRECGLREEYRACVRPLLSMPMGQWPGCCGGRCEPCAQSLVAVALRVCELLKVDPQDLR